MNSSFGDRSKLKNMTYYLTLQEKVQIVQEINHTALFLYEFWVTKLSPSDSNYDFTDEKAARALSMPVGSIRNNRLLLTKHHYFHQIAGKLGGKKAIQTFLGKKTIIKYVYLNNIFDSTSIKYVLSKYDLPEIETEILNHTNDTAWTAEIMQIMSNHK
jgi:hypothetical protein